MQKGHHTTVFRALNNVVEICLTLNGVKPVVDTFFQRIGIHWLTEVSICIYVVVALGCRSKPQLHCRGEIIKNTIVKGEPANRSTGSIS
jgi:hypothetical protein